MKFFKSLFKSPPPVLLEAIRDMKSRGGNYLDLDKIKLLVEKGANVNAKNGNGFTALMECCSGSSSSYEIAKFLIEKGANVNAKDKYGNTPLMHASAFPDDSNLEIVKLLVEKGANVNDKHSSGSTALMHAAISSNFHIAKFLIENGADIYAKNQFNQTPSEMLEKANEMEKIKEEANDLKIASSYFDKISELSSLTVCKIIWDIEPGDYDNALQLIATIDIFLNNKHWRKVLEAKESSIFDIYFSKSMTLINLKRFDESLQNYYTYRIKIPESYIKEYRDSTQHSSQYEQNCWREIIGNLPSKVNTSSNLQRSSLANNIQPFCNSTSLAEYYSLFSFRFGHLAKIHFEEMRILSKFFPPPRPIEVALISGHEGKSGTYHVVVPRESDSADSLCDWYLDCNKMIIATQGYNAINKYSYKNDFDREVIQILDWDIFVPKHFTRDEEKAIHEKDQEIGHELVTRFMLESRNPELCNEFKNQLLIIVATILDEYKTKHVASLSWQEKSDIEDINQKMYAVEFFLERVGLTLGALQFRDAIAQTSCISIEENQISIVSNILKKLCYDHTHFEAELHKRLSKYQLQK